MVTDMYRYSQPGLRPVGGERRPGALQQIGHPVRAVLAATRVEPPGTGDRHAPLLRGRVPFGVPAQCHRRPTQVVPVVGRPAVPPLVQRNPSATIGRRIAAPISSWSVVPSSLTHVRYDQCQEITRLTDTLLTESRSSTCGRCLLPRGVWPAPQAAVETGHHAGLERLQVEPQLHVGVLVTGRAEGPELMGAG